MFNFDLDLTEVKDIIAYSGVRVYPIAYGEVNRQQLEALAASRKSSVLSGNPESVQILLKDLFQTNL